MSCRSFLVVLSVLLVLSSAAFAQKKPDLEKYKPRTLAEIIALNRDGTNQVFKDPKADERNAFIGMDPFYSRVTLQFTGPGRPISTEHRRLMTTWAKLQRADKKFIRVYENEYLFKEGDTEYWVPIQNAGESILTGKYRTGDTLDLLVIYVGANREKGAKDISSLFLSTGFEN